MSASRADYYLGWSSSAGPDACGGISTAIHAVRGIGRKSLCGFVADDGAFDTADDHPVTCKKCNKALDKLFPPSAPSSPSSEE